MVKGIGIDIIEVERVRQSMEHKGFVDRVFTEAEQKLIMARGAVGDQVAAGIFAAKEAVVKALGTGFSGINWRDVEILRNADGAPIAHLYNKAAALAGINYQLHISITHITDTAAGMAVWEVDL